MTAEEKIKAIEALKYLIGPLSAHSKGHWETTYYIDEANREIVTKKLMYLVETL